MIQAVDFLIVAVRGIASKMQAKLNLFFISD